MNDTLIKLIIASFIFGLSLVAGGVPLLYRRGSGASTLISYGESLSSGIFLGTGLLHLLPDALTKFAINYPNQRIPWILLLTATAMLVLKLIEKCFDTLSYQYQAKFLLPILIALLLSVHAFFAGLALGIDTLFASYIMIFFAIIIHKGAAAFALSISMRTAHFKLSTAFIVILLFSVMTPLGIIIGDSLSHLLSSHQAISSEAFFDAFAAGTFIYIALSQQHIKNHANPFYQALAYLAGVIIMAFATVWI